MELVDEFPGLLANTALPVWQKQVNDYVAGLLKRSPVRRADDKVFRDPVVDLQHFYPHEVAIIDSPIVQRLRDVHQNALAYLVYPGATHTRFEHTLGVTTIAGRMISALNERGAKITQKDAWEVRLAALLHDSGHCLF